MSDCGPPFAVPISCEASVYHMQEAVCRLAGKYRYCHNIISIWSRTWFNLQSPSYTLAAASELHCYGRPVTDSILLSWPTHGDTLWVSRYLDVLLFVTSIHVEIYVWSWIRARVSQAKVFNPRDTSWVAFLGFIIVGVSTGYNTTL